MIGLNPIYDISSTNNPLPWTQHWFNSRGLQNAPQGTEIESYIIGGVKQDVKTILFRILNYERIRRMTLFGVGLIATFFAIKIYPIMT